MSRDNQKTFGDDAGSVLGAYVLWTVGVFVAVGAAYGLLHSWLGVPFGFTAPWMSHGDMWDGLKSVWFIFAWGAGLTFLGGVGQALRRTPRILEPEEVFFRGTWVSFNAGFFEEIIYRWLMLFGSMVLIKVLNVVLFGFMHWLYMSLLVPFTNWATFGMLEPQLYGPYGWLFAAGIVSASIRFSKGHEYQGFFGMINSWYIGLFMFVLMFNYGLWTAIVAHIAYDLCVFWTRSLTTCFQPRDYRVQLLRRLLS